MKIRSSDHIIHKVVLPYANGVKETKCGEIHYGSDAIIVSGENR